VVFNIRSVAGRTTGRNSSVCKTSKWGLTAWSDTPRKERLHSSVRAIVVEPGTVTTELTDHTGNDRVREGAQACHDSVGALQAKGHRSGDRLCRWPAAPDLAQQDPHQAERPRTLSRYPPFEERSV
jgi:short-subunit dehydrogenase